MRESLPICLAAEIDKRKPIMSTGEITQRSTHGFEVNVRLNARLRPTTGSDMRRV